jgi:hypothetical protein
MNREALLRGYEKILKTIYSPRHYYERVITFLKEYKPRHLGRKIYFKFGYAKAFLKSLWLLGIKNKERFYYWKLIGWTLARRPRFIGFAISFAIYGFHFRKVSETPS